MDGDGITPEQVFVVFSILVVIVALTIPAIRAAKKKGRLGYFSWMAEITLTQVFVVSSILVVLAVLTIPVLRDANKKGRITTSSCAAKQIGTAMKMYAGDNNGKFPFARADGALLGRGDFSNRAFECLMPKYFTSKLLFFNKQSAWCRNPARDTTATDANLLKKGQNDWIYFAGLSEESDSRWPLFATATALATDLTYSTDVTAKGGVWGGTDAIIGYVDGSAKVENCGDGSMKLPGKTKTFPKRPDTDGNIFTITPEWLGTGSFVLAPE